MLVRLGNVSDFENWYSIARVISERLVVTGTGAIPSKSTVTKWCSQSVQGGEEPILKMKDGTPGVALVDGMYFIHREAIDTFEPPRIGNPQWTAEV